MKLKTYLLASIFLSCLFSCKNLYVQKSVFVPMLENKGDGKIEANLGREGWGVNSAYAPGEHFSVMLNGSSTFENSEQYDRKYNYQAEAGIGYFVNFLDSFHYETYAGISRGVLNSNYSRATEEMTKYLIQGFFSIPASMFNILSNLNSLTYSVNGRGSFNTAFMQHTIAITDQLNAVSLTARCQYIDFNNYEEGVIVRNNIVWYNVYAPPKLFIQPVITDKIAISDHLAFTLQFGLNIELHESENVFEWNKIFFYSGLEYTFHNTPKKLSKIHSPTGY